MGYTTKFTGAIVLSRKLTFAEAKELLEMADDCDLTEQLWGIRHYMQWVPTESLDSIVWDGNEKFYEYTPFMVKLCAWLLEREIIANGELLWLGESSDDSGTLQVIHNVATAFGGKKSRAVSGKPLTMEKLAEMALEQLTKQP